MDSITLYDYSTTKVDSPILSSEQIDKLEAYAQTVWDSRVETLYGEGSNVTNQQIIRFDRKNKVSTDKYVGVIKCGDIKVEIRPKILKGRGVNWGLNLLFWLSYNNRLNIPFHKLDIKNHDSDDVLEILTVLFSKYAYNAISIQPYYAYTTEDCESSFMKGQLVFEKYISNIASGRWHKFHISHKPFIFDNLLNRIIKFVVRKLLSVCTMSREELNKLLFILDEVTDISSCTQDDCDRVNVNPLYEDYYTLIDLCRMFIDNLTISNDDGGDNNYSFILPVNLIFEDFVLGFITKHFPDQSAQGQKRGWLAERDGHWVFQTRNDIFLGKSKVIIDTKYKRRESDGDRKGGVSEKDMYQMVSYAVSGGCDKLMLLYPYIDRKSNDKQCNEHIEFKINNGIVDSPEIRIHACSIDICIDFKKSIQSNVTFLEDAFAEILGMLN